MSYFMCTNCETKHPIFGNGGAKLEAKKLGVPFLDEIPLDIKLRTSSDEGKPITETEPDHIISKKYMSIGSRIMETILKNTKVSPKIIQ